jgi:hypothetical protein
MAIKVKSLTAEEWKKLLHSRLKSAMDYRSKLEKQWKEVESVLSNTKGNLGIEEGDDMILDHEPDNEGADLGFNYAYKMLRYIHSQMSSNPPSTVCKPHTSDANDRHSADAGDRILRFGLKQMDFQENSDQALLKCMTKGTGWVKQFWDVNAGEIIDTVENESGDTEVTMTGEVVMYSPSTWDIWIDPSAKHWKNVRYVFERVEFSREEALALFPEAKEKLEATTVDKIKDKFFDKPQRSMDERIEVFVYYEKAAPINGMAGRYAVCTKDGTLLDKPMANPHVNGGLPYHIITDADIEDGVYGKSNLDYIIKPQMMMNRFDTAMVDSVLTHGVVRMAVQKGTKIDEDAISNSNIDIIEYDDGVPPQFLNPMQLPNDIYRQRDQMQNAIQDIAGINDSMMGNQKREVSGFSQQTAIEAGNMIRKRLFNKYAAFIAGISKDYLELVKEHWSEKRKVHVVGDENAFETEYFDGSDLKGGFDAVVEYGASLPIDPSMRRESIMLLMPILEKAGVDQRQLLSLLKLNDLNGVYDMLTLASNKQRRIFNKMIEENIYIAPEKAEDSVNMLVFCGYFRMSAEYEKLNDNQQALINKHIEDRQKLAAPPAAPAAPAMPAMPAAPAGMPVPPM